MEQSIGRNIIKQTIFYSNSQVPSIPPTVMHPRHYSLDTDLKPAATRLVCFPCPRRAMKTWESHTKLWYKEDPNQDIVAEIL